MNIEVPSAFAESVRNRRMTALSILSIVCFAIAFFHDQNFAGAGYPLMAYLLVILATYRQPLSYNISPKGICLSTPIKALTFPLSLATNFWVSWVFDRVTEIEHTHHRTHPALLIRTKRNPRGTIIPVNRADAEPLAEYLRSTAVRSSVNAFS